MLKPEVYGGKVYQSETPQEVYQRQWPSVSIKITLLMALRKRLHSAKGK